MATCKLGEKGCWKDGKCHYIRDCENKVLTNADRIRAMSDEELAELIVVKIKDIHHQGMRELAYSAWLKWLQRPPKGE